MAAPLLHKRAIMKGDNYVPLGNTTVPLTPLLLIFSALAVALISLLVILFRLFVPSCMSRSSRIILKEREQAKQDLRLRGGSPRHTPNSSPTFHTPRHFSNKPPRRVGHNSLASVPSEITTLSDKRPSHGYRGTSFSLAEARKYSDKSHRSSLSALGLPLLGSSDSSSASSSLHLGAAAMSERARNPISARNDLIGRNPSARSNNIHDRVFAPTLNRNSSVGKGADLQRTRSGPRESRIPIKPQSVDPAYSQHTSRPDSFHPLHQARRDSTLSIYEVHSSAEHSHTHESGSASPTVPSSRMGFFSMATANPLQHSQHVAWASPPPPLHPTPSYSPATPVQTNPYDDSEESTPNSECVSPRIMSATSPTASTTLLVPTRLSSFTQNS